MRWSVTANTDNPFISRLRHSESSVVSLRLSYTRPKQPEPKSQGGNARPQLLVRLTDSCAQLLWGSCDRNFISKRFFFFFLILSVTFSFWFYAQWCSIQFLPADTDNWYSDNLFCTIKGSSGHVTVRNMKFNIQISICDVTAVDSTVDLSPVFAKLKTKTSWCHDMFTLLLLFINEYYIRLPLMTGLTPWSLGCVAKSWADQNVNEGRINTLEASEISVFLKEFRAFSHLQLVHAGLNQVMSWRLGCFPHWFDFKQTNCPPNQNPPTKSLETAVACSWMESLFSSGLCHVSQYRAAQSVVIIWTEYQDNPEKWHLLVSSAVCWFTSCTRAGWRLDGVHATNGPSPEFTGGLFVVRLTTVAVFTLKWIALRSEFNLGRTKH